MTREPGHSPGAQDTPQPRHTPDRRLTASSPPSIRITSPEAVIGALPYLVGFPPERSLVVLVLSGGLLRLTVRVDLPEPQVPLRAWCSDVVSRLRHIDADQAVLVVVPGADAAGCSWLNGRGPRPGADVVAVMRRSLTCIGVDVVDSLLTAEGRWWSFECAGDQCCPHGGRPVSTPEESLVRSYLVFAGVAPTASRQAMEAEFHPAPSEDRRAVASEQDRRRQAIASGDSAPGRPSLTRREWADRATALIGAGEHVGESDVADVVCALADTRVRDAVLWDLTCPADPHVLHRAATVLRDCMRRVSAADVAPLATVLAVIYWQLGDGARARVALRHAHTAQSDYRLAGLISTALDSGLPPAVWRQTMQDLDRETCLGNGTSPPRA